MALVGLCAIQSAIVGLRWSLAFAPAGLLQPVIASLIPVLAWLSFAGLRSERAGAATARPWLHGLAPVVIALLVMGWRPLIDPVLFLIFGGYGAALLRLAWRGPDMLAATRLGDETTAHRALVATALMLILSGAVDLAVAAALAGGQSGRAASIVAIADLLALLAAAGAAAVGGRSHPPTAAAAIEQPPPSPVRPEPALLAADDAAVLQAIDTLMRERRLYRDPDLTLDRLARRAGIPARQISGAVNRSLGRNVSQLVNEYRVEEAKRRLAATDEPVTAVMLESGFGTKSNFNREFLRVAGMSPSAWRRMSGRLAADASETAAPLPGS
ncbi:helix-turn-helix domain-containing protein [Mangrovicella endophytica]|uniref:helix-turn-helix domain-containing protein n=1 Tax=Mangrovicella endophytica TaxID=2066697 RepID=UPI001FE05D99|nr:AraC family transcriptional regulator [Mangrovicella endophytica]